MSRQLRGALAVLLLCCLAPLPGRAGEPGLQPFVALYQLSRNGIVVGTTQVELRLDTENGYLYRAHTTPTGPISLFREDDILEQSSGRILQGRPRPDRYRYRRGGSEIERNLEMDFDWARGTVRIRGQGNWSMQIPPETLDKLVQQLVFSRDLAAGVRQTSYRVADGGRLKDYSYRVLGRQHIRTPSGRYDTHQVSRSKQQAASDYTLWLAPELNHLPVRIRRQHGGATYLMELEELEHGGAGG